MEFWKRDRFGFACMITSERGFGGLVQVVFKSPSFLLGLFSSNLFQMDQEDKYSMSIMSTVSTEAT